MGKLFRLLLVTTLSCSILLPGCGDSSGGVVLDNNTEATNEDSSSGDSTGESSPFGSFTTTSIYGDEVTDAIFSEYDMTMVNIWATWCPPCIGEMAELEEVYQSLPENVNMITLCEDGGRETELAQQILAENGCEFDALIVNDELLQGIMTSIQAFPTTIFVDSDGNVFGSKVEGAPAEPVPYYLDAVESMMGELGL